MQRRSVVTVGGLAALVLIVAVGWYLVSPLFFNTIVNEDLTFAAESTATPAAGEMTSNKDASVSTETIEADEVEPVGVRETADSIPDKEMDEVTLAGNSEPVALRTGEFVDADSFHKGAGTATIYDLPDGGRVLRLEDFEVTNGPDLHVLLAIGEQPTGRNDIGEYVDLGKLKGNLGNQNYEIPADVDISQYQSVVIYCEPFHVVFSTATLNR